MKRVVRFIFKTIATIAIAVVVLAGLVVLTAVTGVQRAIRMSLSAQSCFTQEQISQAATSENKCYYIYQNKVFEKGTPQLPHQGHPCGMDVSSILPESHMINMVAYLDPNFRGEICAAPQPTAIPVPDNSLQQQTPPTATPTQAVINQETQKIILYITATPLPTTPTIIPPTPTVTTFPTPTPTPHSFFQSIFLDRLKLLSGSYEPNSESFIAVWIVLLITLVLIVVFMGEIIDRFLNAIYIRRKIGWVLMVFLSVFPLFIWAMMAPLSARFTGFGPSFVAIGQALGLSGMAMFALTMILSVRLEFFEEYFGGMNKVYIAHHIFGGISLILLLFHPISIAISYISISFSHAASLLIPGGDWTINLGIASLVLLIGLMFITFFSNLPYHIWRLTHQFLGLSFFLGGLHTFFISSDVTRDPVLKMYMMTLTIFGLSAFIFRSVLGKWLVKRYAYQLDEVHAYKQKTVELVLTPLGTPMTYEPGQFLWISFANDTGKGEAHPFSISSSPFHKELKLTIKSLGDYTADLTELPHGTKAFLEGPYGRFSYINSLGRDQVWIAGGIGITPFLSMARTLYEVDFSVDLFYVVRKLDEAVYLEELMEIMKNNLHFRVFPIVSSVQGRFSADKIEEITKDIVQKDFFICGPPPMMKSMKDQLMKKGVKRWRIHTEEFTML